MFRYLSIRPLFFRAVFATTLSFILLSPVALASPGSGEPDVSDDDHVLPLDPDPFHQPAASTSSQSRSQPSDSDVGDEDHVLPLDPDPVPNGFSEELIFTVDYPVHLVDR